MEDAFLIAGEVYAVGYLMTAAACLYLTAGLGLVGLLASARLAVAWPIIWLEWAANHDRLPLP